MYLLEQERKLVTEGMETSIQKIALEVYKSNELTQKTTGKPSKELVKRMQEIDAFSKNFGSYLRERPFIFQKCLFPGLVLAKEIISKAREEVNELCMEDLAREIDNKQKKIEEMKKLEDKTAYMPKYVLSDVEE